MRIDTFYSSYDLFCYSLRFFLSFSIDDTLHTTTTAAACGIRYGHFRNALCVLYIHIYMCNVYSHSTAERAVRCTGIRPHSFVYSANACMYCIDKRFENNERWMTTAEAPATTTTVNTGSQVSGIAGQKCWKRERKTVLDSLHEWMNEWMNIVVNKWESMIYSPFTAGQLAHTIWKHGRMRIVEWIASVCCMVHLHDVI